MKTPTLYAAVCCYNCKWLNEVWVCTKTNMKPPTGVVCDLYDFDPSMAEEMAFQPVEDENDA